MIAAHKLAQNWYWLLVRGLIAIAFGILVFIYPASAIAAFVILFGLIAVVQEIRRRRRRSPERPKKRR